MVDFTFAYAKAYRIASGGQNAVIHCDVGAVLRFGETLSVGSAQRYAVVSRVNPAIRHRHILAAVDIESISVISVRLAARMDIASGDGHMRAVENKTAPIRGIRYFKIADTYALRIDEPYHLRCPPDDMTL